MAHGRGRTNQRMGAWVQNLGEQIGGQLGQIIAEPCRGRCRVRLTSKTSPDAWEPVRGAGGKGARARSRSVASPAAGALCWRRACAGRTTTVRVIARRRRAPYN